MNEDFVKYILKEAHLRQNAVMQGILNYHRTRKLCTTSAIEMKLCLLAKYCRLRKVFELFEFCSFLRR